jgi:hypothetical protein
MEGKAAVLQPYTTHLRELPCEVFIVRNKCVEAYIKWGGKIVMSIGMLDSFETDAEIATILAHEVAFSFLLDVCILYLGRKSFMCCVLF